MFGLIAGGDGVYGGLNIGNHSVGLFVVVIIFAIIVIVLASTDNAGSPTSPGAIVGYIGGAFFLLWIVSIFITSDEDKEIFARMQQNSNMGRSPYDR